LIWLSAQDFHVTKTPLLDTEVRGAALLRLYGRNLLKAYAFGGAAAAARK
jgi:hypothetical protein